MSSEFSYHDYVTDQTFLDDYNAYQAKYAKQMRESDKVLISLVKDFVDKQKLTVHQLDYLTSAAQLETF